MKRLKRSKRSKRRSKRSKRRSKKRFFGRGIIGKCFECEENGKDVDACQIVVVSDFNKLSDRDKYMFSYLKKSGIFTDDSYERCFCKKHRKKKPSPGEQIILDKCHRH